MFRRGAFPLAAPFIPGIEATGRVREVGAGVTGFVAGQPAAALLNDFGRGPRAGGYAEIAVAHASMAATLPADADLARVAGVMVNGTTAWISTNLPGWTSMTTSSSWAPAAASAAPPAAWLRCIRPTG